MMCVHGLVDSLAPHVVKVVEGMEGLLKRKVLAEGMEGLLERKVRTCSGQQAPPVTQPFLLE